MFYLLFICFFRYAKYVTRDDDVLTPQNGELILEKVVDVSNLLMQGKCCLKYNFKPY